MTRFDTKLRRLTFAWAHPSLHEDPEQLRRAELTLLLLAVAVAIGTLFAIGNVMDERWTAAAIVLAASFGGGIVITAVLRTTGSLAAVAHCACGIWMAGLTGVTYGPEGFGLVSLTATGIVPMIGVFIAGVRVGVVWAGICCANVVAFVVLGETAVHPVAAMLPVLFVLCTVIIAAAYESVRISALAGQARSEDERRRALVEKVEAEQEAQLARSRHLASVGQMAASVGHEINNPLTYVMTNLEVLRRHHAADDQETADIIDEALEGAQRVHWIVQDLNAFARAGTEAPQVLEVREIVDAALKLADNEIRHRATLKKSIEDDCRVEGAESELVQVLVNLLLNAAQSIPVGHVEKQEIEISARREGEWVVIQVRDTGCGIPEGDLPRIFEPFYTTKPSGVGTGLGLLVCRNIVLAHHGRLNVDSTEDEGTEVTIRLPAEEAELEKTSEAPPTPDADACFRVLIVDDEPMVRRALQRLLTGRDVTCSASGREAVELLQEDDAFDVILCDVMMPDVTGVDVHRELRAVNEELAERLVFMTGGAFDASLRDYLEATDNLMLSKPIRPVELDEVFTKVGRMVRLSRP